MPGITGFINSEAPSGDEQQLVTEMLGSMLHELFYTAGTHFVPEMGIYVGWVAHENSQTVGQVFFNERRDIALVFSGECFADPRVSIGLRQKGHKFETSGANWLVHFYEEEGDRFFEKLNGLFSGLLIDRRRKKAFLFNDRYGAERIYFHEDRGSVYFASEAKALLRVLPQLREFDEHGVAEFFTFGCTLGSRTLFRGVKLLPGGSLWTFERGTCHKSKYFLPETWETQPALTPSGYEAQFQETFKTILPHYFESESEIGISLTGGLDTRMIMACRPQTTSLVTYTFSGLAGETMDDRIAAKVARASGLQHRLLRLAPGFFSDFADHVDQTVYVTDGTLGATGAHEIYLNRQARGLAPVRLTGLYGSETLRGVSTFKPLGLSRSMVNCDFAQTINTAAGQFRAHQKHPVACAVFENVPWNLFGSAAASRSQVTLRTPYLDNELVAFAFRAPENLRRSHTPGLRLVRNNNRRLADIPTDRRIECKYKGTMGRLQRLPFEASFKLDYFYNEGMPHWFVPFDRFLEQANSRVRFLGHHKYLHYRRWFRHELAKYVQDVVADARRNPQPFWNYSVFEYMANDHICGRRNYVMEINAVLTLATVDRLLLRELSSRFRDIPTKMEDRRQEAPVPTR
jgi:asparagine synthase (glutamine-hydrolysing)